MPSGVPVFQLADRRRHYARYLSGASVPRDWPARTVATVLHGIAARGGIRAGTGTKRRNPAEARR
jgi:hypothetical protein